MPTKAFLILALIGATLQGAGVSAQERSKCPEYDLIAYSEPRDAVNNRVLIEPDTEFGGRFPALRRFDELPSTFRTASALISEPDTKKRGPWTTVIAIRGNEAREIDLLVTFKSHGMGGVQPRWLNEKLIAFRVWWAKTIASEMILNVETAELLYHQEADYGQVAMPCEEKAQLIAASRDAKSEQTRTPDPAESIKEVEN
jgi:hypothetical protein